MRLHISPQALVTGSAACLILAAVGAGMLMHKPAPNSHTASTTRQSAQAKTQHPAANNATGNTPNSSASAASTGHTDAPAAAGPACELLTLGIARQLLGPDATSSLPDSTSGLQTSHTTVSACAYSNTTGSVQLIVRTPADSLGASKNATVFGSGKPQGAVTVEGYGQTAYWDPGKHQLNILGSNTWYAITRSTNTQADTEAVAKLLAEGF